MMVALIVLVPVVGGLLLEYKKLQLKESKNTESDSEEMKLLVRELTSLKKRVENLEAIAAETEAEEPLLRRTMMDDLDNDMSTKSRINNDLRSKY